MPPVKALRSSSTTSRPSDRIRTHRWYAWGWNHLMFMMKTYLIIAVHTWLLRKILALNWGWSILEPERIIACNRHDPIPNMMTSIVLRWEHSGPVASRPPLDVRSH